MDAQLRSGDIVAFKGHGLMSDLIRLVERSSYSHVGIIWLFRGQTYVLQATGAPNVGAQFGVGIVHASETGGYGTCDWLQTGVEWTDDLEHLALSCLGKPYDYAACVKVGLDFTPEANSEICSLYCAQVMVAAGHKLPRKGMTPAALVDDLLSEGAVLRTIDLPNIGQAKIAA